jgi:hypothetical protein
MWGGFTWGGAAWASQPQYVVGHAGIVYGGDGPVGDTVFGGDASGASGIVVGGDSGVGRVVGGDERAG